MNEVRKYLNLVTFSHTIFAMPFAILGFFIAVGLHNYPFEWILLLKVILSMVFARNAAMGLNRYADRKLDAKNPRTAKREIPSGHIKSGYALIFTLINAALFILTTWTINQLCFYLSPIALAVILGYSYTKRFTAWCHLILGIGLAIAPIGAYLAVSGQFHWFPLMLSGLVITWVSGFDIIYALQDELFDKEEKLFSIPAKIGAKNALGTTVLLHILTAAVVITTGFLGDLSFIYWIGAGIFIALLVYQHLIVKPSDLSRVNRAFGTTNGIASVIYALFFIWSIYQ